MPVPLLVMARRAIRIEFRLPLIQQRGQIDIGHRALADIKIAVHPGVISSVFVQMAAGDGAFRRNARCRVASAKNGSRFALRLKFALPLHVVPDLMGGSR